MAHTNIRENPVPIARRQAPVGTRDERPHSRVSSNYRPRHQTGWARPAWQQKYLASLIGTEVAAAFLGAAVAFVARFGVVNSHSRIYIFTLLLLPVLWLTMLGLARAFESRYLFVGTDEYQRVVHAALGLTALVALVSYAFELPISRAFVLIAIPVTAMSSIVARFVWRQWLHRMRRHGRCMKKVIVVGHESSVAALTGQLQREHYHGLQVVGACVPTGRAQGAMLEFDAPVWGGFDEVAEAVSASRADTVIVLSCPEFDGVALRRLGWRLERGEVDLIVASALVDVAGDRTTVRPVDGLPMLHLEHAT